MKRGMRSVALVAAMLPWLVAGCPGSDPGAAQPARRVTVYCALDQVYASSVLEDFEDRSGITVEARFDVEATKTTGLVNAILAEQARPRCDVFWSNEVAQTAWLARQGLMASYQAEAATAIPPAFRDPQNRWFGFAARLRVLLVNTDLVPEDKMPTSVEDLRDPRWRGRVGIAKPLFGTTATWAASLFVTRGAEAARGFFADLLENQVVICAGNAHVKDRVAAGELAFGLTDSDDANVARLDGRPVLVVIPDQAPGQPGTLAIPNSVAILKAAPHPTEARALVEFLLSEEVEAGLAAARSAQIPVRDSILGPEQFPPLSQLQTTRVDWAEVGAKLREVSAELKESFLGGH